MMLKQRLPRYKLRLLLMFPHNTHARSRAVPSLVAVPWRERFPLSYKRSSTIVAPPWFPSMDTRTAAPWETILNHTFPTYTVNKLQVTILMLKT